MKNLGKTLLVLWVFGVAALYGALTASVDESRVTMGDTVTFKLEANGQQVQKPAISELCGQKVLSTSEGVSMQSVNGRFTKAYTFTYTFEPQKYCTIDPVVLSIDGKEERTEPIDIRVIPMKITKDAPFILAMRSEQQKVHVGEPFKVVITFKQRRGSEAVDSKFQPPQVNNFWVKEEAQSRRFEEGDYTVTHLTYVLAAQKPGKLTIDPAQIKIATRSASKDVWGQWLPQLKWRTYFSNAVDVEVLPLPEGINLVGNFTIEVTADKREIEVNEAVNVTLKIGGSGNFEDIGAMKPTVDGVSVFEEEPEVNGYLEQGVYKGFWQQKLAFVAEKSFTIPSITLTYYDPKAQKVKTIRSEPVDILVKGAAPKMDEGLNIKRAEPTEDAGGESPSLFSEGRWELPFAAGAVLGLLLGLVLALIPWRSPFGKGGKEGVDPKDEKAVLKQLLPHRANPEVAAMVEILEANLYGGTYRTVDRKALKALLKKYVA